jgi:hypothetical protein
MKRMKSILSAVLLVGAIVVGYVQHAQACDHDYEEPEVELSRRSL